LTDQNGQVISRRDFLPFGEEIQRANYGSDSVRNKFTGYQRDDETNLDYAKARMFGSGLGRFTSPDNFLNDSQVNDPQSWNEYAYARNNPLKITDHSGRTADVNIKIDEKNKTGVITVTATIAVWSKDKAVGEGDLAQAASDIQKNINDTWKGSFVKDGITYTVQTTVTVTVYANEKDAKKSGDQNVIELMRGSPDGGKSSALSGSHSFWTGKDSGQWNINKIGTGSGKSPSMPAHEFGHLLGIDDKQGKVMMNTDPSKRHSVLTAADFDAGFGSEINQQRKESRYDTKIIDRERGYTKKSVDVGYERNSNKDYTFSAPSWGWWKSR
jgi:RHS repeat-associated protein